jgi:hypothetical protein
LATVLQAQLLAPTVLTAAAVAVYTAPALTTVKIGRAVFSNTDTSPHTITVNIGTTATAANQIINARTLAAGETYVSPELAGLVIPAGQQMWALASTATIVNMTMSGITITGT